MASIEAALVAALMADAGVVALAAGRVAIAGGTQGTAYPYVTVQRISTPGTPTLIAASTLDYPRFQVDCWGADALSALNLGEAVRSALDHVTIAGDPEFTATFQDQSGPAPDEETRKFRVSQDYFLWHERA